MCFYSFEETVNGFFKINLLIVPFVYEMQRFFVYWLCILQFYWIHLVPTVLIEFLGFKMYKFMSSASRDNFTFFQIWISFFFLFLTLLLSAETFNTMLNRSGRSDSIPLIRFKLHEPPLLWDLHLRIEPQITLEDEQSFHSKINNIAVIWETVLKGSHVQTCSSNSISEIVHCT